MDIETSETKPYLPYTNEPSATRHPALQEQRRRRRAFEIYQRARESRAGLAISWLMARWTIGLAAEREPNPAVRERRKRLLIDRWHHYFNDLMGEAMLRPHV